LAHEPPKRSDDKADNPPRITPLVNIPFQAILEGYYYHHVQAIIVATDQYPEAALEVREFFPNRPRRIC
jgi:hypothetical protein